MSDEICKWCLSDPVPGFSICQYHVDQNKYHSTNLSKPPAPASELSDRIAAASDSREYYKELSELQAEQLAKPLTPASALVTEARTNPDRQEALEIAEAIIASGRTRYKDADPMLVSRSFRYMVGLSERLADALSQSESRSARYREALEWYADATHYDRGDRARAALSESP